MVNSRQADRLGVSAQGSFRRGPGLAQSAEVVDLTPLGCRLIDIPRNLARGEPLSLRIGSVGPIAATVRWLKLGREAGLEFDTPLSDVAFNVLLGQHHLAPQDPVRAELMALHNDALAGAAAELEAMASERLEAAPLVAYEAGPEEADKVVSIHAGDPEAERRASQRIAANDPAMIFAAGSSPVEVRIADFSHTGMRLGIADASVLPGSVVSIVFPDNEVVHGEVRWNDGRGLGIRVLGVGEAPLEASSETMAEPDLADLQAAEASMAIPADTDATVAARLDESDLCDFASLPEVDEPPQNNELPSHLIEAVETPEDTAIATDEPTPLPEPSPAAAFLTELDCAPEGLAALPDMPTDHLERFAALLEAARACDFAAIKIRVTAEGIDMDLAYRP